MKHLTNFLIVTLLVFVLALPVNSGGWSVGTITATGGQNTGGVYSDPLTGDTAIPLTAGYVKVDASAATVNLTLPPVASAGTPCQLTFICTEPVGANSINIYGYGAELIIDNNLCDLLNDKGDILRIISDGSQWWIH